MTVSPQLTEKEKYKQNEEAEEALPVKDQEKPLKEQTGSRPLQSNRHRDHKGDDGNTEGVKKRYQQRCRLL